MTATINPAATRTPTGPFGPYGSPEDARAALNTRLRDEAAPV